MPQILVQEPVDREVPQKTASASTYRGSNKLIQAVLSSLQSTPLGIGSGSFCLHSLGARAINDFLATGEVADDEIWFTLIELYDLLTWPDGWNGYDAAAPKYEAVRHAYYWIKQFYQKIRNLRLNWLKPNVTASGEGEVVFEWRNGIKNLTIYIGSQGVDYVKDWGADVGTEMEDGHVNSLSGYRVLWLWLMS